MATEAERHLEFLLRHYTANRILSEPDDQAVDSAVENQQSGKDSTDDASNGNGNGNSKKGKKRERNMLEHRNIT